MKLEVTLHYFSSLLLIFTSNQSGELNDFSSSLLARLPSSPSRSSGAITDLGMVMARRPVTL